MLMDDFEYVIYVFFCIMAFLAPYLIVVYIEKIYFEKSKKFKIVNIISVFIYILFVFFMIFIQLIIPFINDLFLL